MELREMHFLVVDDMEVMRKVNADQLRSLGATKIELASNGLEALKIIRDRNSRGARLDLVLTDLNMPVMDGLDMLRAVRGDAKLAHLPIVMITAEADRKQITEAISTGVSELLLKPYTAQKLCDKISSALLRAQRFAAMPKASASDSAQPIASLVPEASIKPAAGGAPQSTILIVDDTPDNLRLMSGLFDEQYRVRVAHNGKKALAICTSDDPPDLVLLDVMMPDMDGFEVVERMREHPTSDTIPVIFVTALDDLKSRHRGLDLGAMDFVRKPIDPNELILRVRNFMRYIELHRQRQADYDEMLGAARLREEIDRMLRHDIKGPLAGVIGLTRRLREDNLLTASQQGEWALIEDTVAQVLDTVDLSAELFKIETGRYQPQPQPVPVGEMLHRVADLARGAFASKKLTLTVTGVAPGRGADAESGAEASVGTIAQGDPKLCYSAFHNLVKNACEAAPEGSTVSLTLHDRSRLAVTIENQGVVPLAVRELLFTKYATSKRGGSGLGTYSAKLLIEAQGGAISLETFDHDNRTVVSVILPTQLRS
jgi:two-component system sensor histidine kinase/response regulator